MDYQAIKDYYGKVLSSSSDLKTSACCTPDAMPQHLRRLAANIHDEVSAKYYGCGLVAPTALAGRRVVDLGSGSGRDVYMLAQLVGPEGEVVGVDMTPEQLEVARRHVGWHTERFGYARPNVRFVEGYIESLGSLGLTPGSVDVIVSNCVLNLSPDKPAVLRGAYELLAPGGELYFSDVYADRRVSAEVASDPVLRGECLGGALYWNDFLPMAKRAGFLDPRLVTSRPLEISDPVLAAKLGATRFYSATYRLFKLPALEPACEDYGQAVVYRGGSRRSRTPLCSTGTTSSSAARCSRCAATRGVCCTRPAFGRTSTLSVTSGRTTASSRAAARPSRSPRPAAARRRVRRGRAASCPPSRELRERDGLEIRGGVGQLLRREAGVDLHQVAVGVLEPQLVERCAAPGGARGLVHGEAGVPRQRVRRDDGGAIGHGDAEVIERVVVQLVPVGDEQHEVGVELGADEGGVAVGPLLRLGAEQPGVEPGARKRAQHLLARDRRVLGWPGRRWASAAPRPPGTPGTPPRRRA
jgi:arsenite methyltransferase